MSSAKVKDALLHGKPAVILPQELSRDDSEKKCLERREDHASTGSCSTCNDKHRSEQRGRCNIFPEQECSPEQRQHRLKQLYLTDARYSTDGKTSIPGKEPKKHADHGDISKTEPCCWLCRVCVQMK